MAKAKEERNKLFLEDWQKGLSNESLAEKYSLSVGGVKALKQRLRVKQTGQVKPNPSSQVMSTSTQTSAPTSTKRMTFWLPRDTIKAIKTKTKRESRTASAILREILEKNL